MALIDITPVMTSNTTPAPYVVSASSIYSEVSNSWKAFDGDSLSHWSTQNTTITGWIKLDFSIPTKVDAFSIASVVSANRTTSPKEFILYGSDDDILYEKVLEVSNQLFWIEKEKRLYKLPTRVSFRYYKLIILSNNGSTVSTVIGELNFYENDEFEQYEYVTNKKASLNYCLPKNSTLKMTQRQNDPREGLLGFANDPDDRYGTLYIIDNKGQAIVPKASMTETDILFDGLASEESTYELSESIENYKMILVYGGIVYGGTNDVMKAVQHLLIKIDKQNIYLQTFGLQFETYVTQEYSFSLSFNFTNNKTINILYNRMTNLTNVSISKIYGIK